MWRSVSISVTCASTWPASSQNPKKTIDDIAEDCGFTDRIHFSKVFKRLTGETPGQYRRLLNTTAKKTVPRNQSPGEEPALSPCIAYTRSRHPPDKATQITVTPEIRKARVASRLSF